MTRPTEENAVQRLVLIILAFTAGLAGCAGRELRCDGALEPINAAPAVSRTQQSGDDHAR
jgi:hypothetical protein